jgi:glycosyltransferase involved in cell wall biosynthesis
MNVPRKDSEEDLSSLGKIAIVQTSDAQNEPRGGTDTYFRGFARALERRGAKVWRVDVALSQPRHMEREIVIADYHISNYMAPLFLCGAALKMRRERDWIVNVQRPDQLLPFLLIADKKRLYVALVSGPIRTAMTAMRPKLTVRLYSLIELIGFRMADIVIFVDKRTADIYAKLYPWLARKSFVLPVGIDPEFFDEKSTEKEAKKRYGFGENDRVICFIGRLGPEKNVDLILRSFAQIHKENKNIRLAIAGEGDQREMLERLSLELEIADSAKFLGRLSHSDVRDLLSASEILILASKWEGSPTVVREALAARTRIVATNVGDISELIRDASLGRIIPEASEPALAEGIRETLRTERPKEVQPFVREFSWDRIGDNLISIYKKTESEKRGVP